MVDNVDQKSLSTKKNEPSDVARFRTGRHTHVMCHMDVSMMPFIRNRNYKAVERLQCHCISAKID
jgi:hypothetical protein